MLSALAIVFLVVVCTADDYPFRNTSLSFEARVADLVERLNISEIAGQMSHGGARKNSPTPAIERLGIKPYQFGTECLSGDVGAGAATSFPQALGMAASFDYDLVYRVTEATSKEVRAKNNNATALGDYSFHTGLSCWSPVVNIMRDPRWGRNQETFGECPYLSGQMKRVVVLDDHRYVRANAGCKHFDVHGGPEDVPVSRFSFDSKVSDRDWRMTFLPQFEACVMAGSYSLMCSFNSIQGVPACANSKLLTEILRNEWNFEGYVVSDQGALENIMTQHNYTQDPVHTAAAAVNAGTCLEDGNDENTTFSHLEEAYNQKLVNESTLRDCASRLFMTRMVLGEFDPPEMNPYSKLDVSIIQSREHQDLARFAAGKSFVLLKNEKNVLPLREHSLDQMTILGPFANDSRLLFGDYSPTIMENFVTTPLAGLTYSMIARRLRMRHLRC
ncbi:xylan 1,4-beta-xylosidase-like [Oscarella lobularis]|uniref:xylan 1,4-beta-xylosidase-like n=1 Tax=Oscarella lobularis TaxID=121494 RepID=UPI0033144DC6